MVKYAAYFGDHRQPRIMVTVPGAPLSASLKSRQWQNFDSEDMLFPALLRSAPGTAKAGQA